MEQLNRKTIPENELSKTTCSIMPQEYKEIHGRRRAVRVMSLASLSLSRLIVFIILLAEVTVQAKNSQYNIFWNTTNPMFRIDNTDNVLDINQGNQAWEYDQANIICPLYLRGTREADMERYVIYRVSKEEFDNCNILDPNPRVIAVCNRPHKLMYFTITFRSFTPTPGGLEFKPGQDYYFISTSSRTDLQRRKGGRCQTNNMRLVFKIAPSSGQHTTTVRPPSWGGVRDNEDDLYQEYLSPTSDISSELNSNSVEHDKRSEEYTDSNDAKLVKQASVVASSVSGLLAEKCAISVLLISCACVLLSSSLLTL